MFNQKTEGINKTINYEGEVAYKESPEMELYSLVCTSIMQDKFYEKSTDRINRLRDLIKKVDDEYIIKLAIYAREKMYLRAIPLVLMVELLKKGSQNKLITSGVERVIQRADELTEILSYYELANNRTGTKKLNKLSKRLQRGIAKAFNKFNEYNFSKYNREKSIKLRDALFLTHPKAKDDEQQKLFDKIAKDELTVPYTWEVELSGAKLKGKTKKQVWEELIDSNKLGYMALLRNLRNILDEDVSVEHIKKIAIKLSDEKEVLNSKQLPFRFLSAYKEAQKNDNPFTSTILNALEDAIKISFSNIKGFDYNTLLLIASDVSGSMNSSISEKSSVMFYDIGLLLSMGLQSKCKSCITGIFGDRFKIKQFPQQSILQNISELYHTSCNEVGCSTNGYLVLKHLIDNKILVDKIMVFTDCQLWDSNQYGDNGGSTTFSALWGEYLKINPNSKLYMFDLQGYGNTPVDIKNNNVFLIAGWNEKVFEMLDALENKSSIIAEIKKIEVK